MFDDSAFLSLVYWRHRQILMTRSIWVVAMAASARPTQIRPKVVTVVQIESVGTDKQHPAR